MYQVLADAAVHQYADRGTHAIASPLHWYSSTGVDFNPEHLCDHLEAFVQRRVWNAIAYIIMALGVVQYSLHKLANTKKTVPIFKHRSFALNALNAQPAIQLYQQFSPFAGVNAH